MDAIIIVCWLVYFIFALLIAMEMIMDYKSLSTKQKVLGFIVTFPFGILIRFFWITWNKIGHQPDSRYNESNW
jgi:glycopeptide antibiotics resistance protein